MAATLLVIPTTWKHYYWYLYPTVLAVIADLRDRETRPLASKILVVALLMLTLPHRMLPRVVWEPFHVFHGLALGCLVVLVLMYFRLRRREAPSRLGGVKT